MNLPFSLIPANTSLKLHIIRKTASIDNIIVAHSIRHFTYNKRKNMTVANGAFWCSSELTSEKTVVIVVLWSMAFIFTFIFKNKLTRSLRKKGLVFPYSYRWCLTAKLMNCFLQALQCFSDLHQLGLYLIFLLRGILVWGGGILIGFLP